MTSSIIGVVMSSRPDWSEKFLIFHITYDSCYVIIEVWPSSSEPTNQEVRFSSVVKCKKGPQVLTLLLKDEIIHYYYYYYMQRQDLSKHVHFLCFRIFSRDWHPNLPFSATLPENPTNSKGVPRQQKHLKTRPFFLIHSYKIFSGVWAPDPPVNNYFIILFPILLFFFSFPCPCLSFFLFGFFYRYNKCHMRRSRQHSRIILLTD